MKHFYFPVFTLFCLLLAACEQAAEPKKDVRQFRATDTVSVYFYRNWQGTGQPAKQEFFFDGVTDTIYWSEASAEFNRNWMYYDWSNLRSTDQWEFAFPAVSEFDQLSAPDSYQFFGASTYVQAGNTYPAQLWQSVAVRATFTTPTHLILARHPGEPYPIVCLKNIRAEALPESADSSNYYQDYAYIYKLYY